MITKLINRVTQYIDLNNLPSVSINFALFRILFFGHILFTIYSTNVYKGLIFDSISGITKNPFPFNTFLWVWAICAAMMMMGWFTKYISIVQYICIVFAYQLFNRSGIASYYSDLMLMGSFLCIFFPISKSYSIDAMVSRVMCADASPKTTPKYQYTIFIFLTLGLMYVGSAITKIGSPIWQQGIGLWIPLNMPFFKWHGLANYIADFEWPLKAINYFVIIWEILFVFLIFSKRFKKLTIFIGIAFHVGIATLFYFPEIALATLIFYLLFIPDLFWNMLSRKIRVPNPQNIFVSENTIIANRAWAFFSGLDFRHKFKKVTDDKESALNLNNQQVFVQLLNSYWLYKTLALFVASGAHRGILKLLHFSLSPSITNAPLRVTPQFKIYALVCFTLFATAVQSFVSTRFFIKQLTTEKAVHFMPKKQSNQSTNFSRPSQIARSLFGINSRGLFLDNGIAAKRTMIAIACYDSTIRETTLLPLTDLKGYHTSGKGAWTKTYTHYLYQNNPLSLTGLEKILRYWSSKNRRTLTGTYFVILKRNYPESNHFEHQYWQKMERLPWDTAGIAFWQNDTFRYVPVVKDSISVK